MKKGFLIVITTILLMFMASAVMAKGPKGKVPSGQSERSPIGHLYLFEKNTLNDMEMEIIWDGAWGKMKYSLWGKEFRFVFNGHRLTPTEAYTLIYYPEPSGEGLICLGSDIADEDGNVHIRESVDTCDLPSEVYDSSDSGAKIWLMLSSDVDCASRSMIDSDNPSASLYGYNLIKFTDTDGCEDEFYDEIPDEESPPIMPY